MIPPISQSNPRGDAVAEPLRRSTVRRALSAIPTYTRMSRHARALFVHSTPRKLANLALVEAEYRLGRTRVKGRPYVLIVDPINVCNLRCPLCPTGTGDLGRAGSKMPWETYTRVIDELAPYAYEVNLYNWGESILHPHIFEMIEYAAQRNVATVMSANLNDVRGVDIDSFVTSGLEHLTLSIDGISQETYAKYRVRGDLETVLGNARRIVEAKRRLGSRTPIIEWQFIVFKHNAHEIERAREMAGEMGVDRFRLLPPGVPFAAPEQERLKRDWFVPSVSDTTSGEVEDFRGQIEAPCFYLYRSFTVNPDAQVAPCCVVYGDENDFGNFLADGFAAIWNGPKYQSARSLFRAKGQATVPTVCDGCEMFRKPTSNGRRAQQ